MLCEIPVNARRDYVLPDSAALYLKSTSEMSKRIHDHFEACGVTTQKPGTGRLTETGLDGKTKKVSTGKRAVVEVGFHSLRHTFVSLCREANAPLSVVEAIVGHSNPAMTRHYTHTSEAAAGAAVAALPDVTGQTKVTLPAATLKIERAPVRTLVERLTPSNAGAIRQELLALLDAQ